MTSDASERKSKIRRRPGALRTRYDSDHHIWQEIVDGMSKDYAVMQDMSAHLKDMIQGAHRRVVMVMKSILDGMRSLQDGMPNLRLEPPNTSKPRP